MINLHIFYCGSLKNRIKSVWLSKEGGLYQRDKAGISKLQKKGLVAIRQMGHLNIAEGSFPRVALRRLLFITAGFLPNQLHDLFVGQLQLLF